MIAREYTVTVEAQVSDLYLWLASEAEYDLAYEMALAEMYFDPLSALPDDIYDRFEYDADWRLAAMHKARTYYPDLYNRFVYEFWTLDSETALNNLKEQLQWHVPGIADYIEEMIGYGYLDLESVAIMMDDAESVAMHEYLLFDEDYEFAPMLYRDIGFMWDDYMGQFGFDMHVQEQLFPMLISAMIEHGNRTRDIRWHNLAIFFQWAINSTGNTLADLTQDAILDGGLNYPSWDDLDFAWVVQLEAYDLYDMAIAGIQFLHDQPLVANAVIAHYQTLYRTLQAEGMITDDDFTGRQAWPILDYDERDGAGFTDAQRHYSDIRPWRDRAYADSLLRG